MLELNKAFAKKLAPGVLSESRSIKLATFSVGGMFPGSRT
jgi:hypothetical protein